MRHSPQNSQRGLTLVEMMVSIVLSLLLLAAAIQIFTANKQTFRMVEASSRVQENGRFAVAFLRPVLRSAGNTGCANLNKGATLNRIADPSRYGSGAIQDAINTFGDGVGVKGYTYSGGALPAELVTYGLTRGTATGDVWESSTNEILVIKFGGACPGGNIVQVMPSTSANIKIKDAASCGIQQNDLVIVSDCQNADLFGVTNNPNAAGANKDTLAHASNLNIANTLTKAYGTDASVYKLNVVIFYIGRGASGEPALFRRQLVNGSFQNEELVEDVEQMRAVFGIDTDNPADGTANYYVAPASVPNTNWADVSSVRVTLTVRSKADRVTVNNQRLTHVFSATIKVRNSL